MSEEKERCSFMAKLDSLCDEQKRERHLMMDELMMYRRLIEEAEQKIDDVKGRINSMLHHLTLLLELGKKKE